MRTDLDIDTGQLLTGSWNIENSVQQGKGDHKYNRHAVRRWLNVSRMDRRTDNGERSGQGIHAGFRREMPWRQRGVHSLRDGRSTINKNVRHPPGPENGLQRQNKTINGSVGLFLEIPILFRRKQLLKLYKPTSISTTDQKKPRQQTI